jgi:hypothetical protein
LPLLTERMAPSGPAQKMSSGREPSDCARAVRTNDSWGSGLMSHFKEYLYSPSKTAVPPR